MVRLVPCLDLKIYKLYDLLKNSWSSIWRRHVLREWIQRTYKGKQQWHVQHKIYRCWRTSETGMFLSVCLKLKKKYSNVVMAYKNGTKVIIWPHLILIRVSFKMFAKFSHIHDIKKKRQIFSKMEYEDNVVIEALSWKKISRGDFNFTIEDYFKGTYLFPVLWS